MISDQQTPHEWLWFVDQVKPVKKFLEIGSFNGNSLAAVVTSGLLLADGLIRSIDRGEHGTAPALQNMCEELTHRFGVDTRCLIGDSHAADSVAWAGQWAPYDLLFIDGDHSYEGVRSDWEFYGPMARIIALHDVGGHEPGCVKLWNEIKNGFRSAEKTADPLYQIIGRGQQGIGIIWRT